MKITLKFEWDEGPKLSCSLRIGPTSTWTLALGMWVALWNNEPDTKVPDDASELFHNDASPPLRKTSPWYTPRSEEPFEHKP